MVLVVVVVVVGGGGVQPASARTAATQRHHLMVASLVCHKQVLARSRKKLTGASQSSVIAKILSLLVGLARLTPLCLGHD